MAMGIGALIVAAVTSFGATAALVTGIIIDAALSLAANSLLSKKPDLGGAGQRSGRTENVRSTTFPHHAVYGEVRKGGMIFYINGTGSNNKYLHLSLAVAAHECESIDDIHFNGELLELHPDGATRMVEKPDWPESGPEYIPQDIGGKPTGSLRDYAVLKMALGTSTQAAQPMMVSENSNWTTEHRARGVAYVYARLRYSQAKFPNFIPAITARMKGQNAVYDPRSSSGGWSDNPALIVADIIERYLKVPRERIDAAHLIEAANICDTLVPVKGGGFEKRYTAGGFFELEGNPSDWLEPFVNAMAGNVTEYAGIYYISAGAFKGSVLTITEDDIVSSVRYRTASSDFSRSNSAKGVFIGRDTYDQPTEFPAVKDAVAIAEDGGVTNWLELNLEMVQSHRQAQRVANTLLQSSREDETVEMSLGLLAGLDIKPWDTVTLDLPSMGLSGTWQVQTHALNVGNGGAMQVDVALKRHTAAVFDWDAETQEQDISNTASNLPGSTVNAPQLVEYVLTLHTSHALHYPADISLNWQDPSGSVLELEVEATLDYQYRATDTDDVTAGVQPGPWENGSITQSVTVAEGVGSAVLEMQNLDLVEPNGFDFQEWNVTSVRIRSKIDDTTWGEWVDATPS